jgi:hypothetical protein
MKFDKANIYVFIHTRKHKSFHIYLYYDDDILLKFSI